MSAGAGPLIAFMKPHRLTGKSAWQELLPLAFAVTDWTRPRKIVELGTHVGDSYCAFCQAVSTLKLTTTCTAVDTWQGDEHAGAYDQSVLDELKAYHDPLYGRFSTLFQGTFDQALTLFENRSVDLLHIDGLHTYKAVKHDFETWLPKMSERGVVLFHDTDVRERNFGVWQVWEELSKRYPSHEFKFGHGLGILAVGKEVPSGLKHLFDENNPALATTDAMFKALGERCALLALSTAAQGQQAQTDALRLELQNMRNSTSWKITEPMRAALEHVRFKLNHILRSGNSWRIRLVRSD